MAQLIYQRDSIAYLLGAYLAPASAYTVTVFPQAAVVNGNQSGTSITVCSGHGVPLSGGKAAIYRAGLYVSGSFVTVSSSTATTVVFPSSVTVIDGDLIVYLGTDGGSSVPSYDGSTFPIYATPQTVSAVTQSKITSDSGGEFQYWCRDGARTLIVRASASVVDVKQVTAVGSTPILDASVYAGSDMAAQIAAAIADLPSTGGVIDARGISGTQSASTNPFASVTKKVQLLLGSCTVTTTAQWAIPNECSIVGSGRNTTVLKADATFPTSTALVRIGQGLASVGVTGVRVEQMTLDCNDVAGSIGIYSTEANEICGGTHLLIQKYRSAGISLAINASQKPDNYLFDDIEMYASTSTSTADAVSVGTGVGVLGVFRRITMNTLGGGSQQARGAYVATGAHFYDCHIEYCTEGFYFDTASSGASVHNASLAVSGTTLIRLKGVVATSGSGTFIFTNLVKGAATNVLINDYLGTTLTEGILPYYATSTTTGTYQAYRHGVRSSAEAGNVESLVQPVWSVKSKETPPSTGSSQSIFALVDSNNDGWFITASSPTAASPGFLTLQKVVGGTASTNPVVFRSDGRLTLTESVIATAGTFTGAVTSSGGGVGYAAGAGGTISQTTDKSTTVILNKLTGRITLNGAALGANTSVSFTFTNSFIAATDLLVFNHVSGGTIGAYTFNSNPAGGSATVTVRNVSDGSLSEAPVVAFAVIKAVTS